MSRFSNNWDSAKGKGLGNRLAGRLNTPEPLKPRLEQATRQIQSVIGALDSKIMKFRERDSALFNKMVASLQKRDNARATIFANEIAEVRKINKMVTQSKLALEQILLRLNTITDLGELVSILGPATAVVGTLRQGLQGVLPEADGEMSEISGLLSGILVDAGSVSETSLNFQTSNEEAESVLSEAAAVAESRMEGLPKIPISATDSDSEMEAA